MQEKESGESSPLSSIEEIQRRLTRPSQDSSFRYPIADLEWSGDRKSCESLTITQYARSEFADRIAGAPKCLKKLAKVYPNSGDHIADLKSHDDDRKRLPQSPTVDDLSVDDSAPLIDDFKEHELFVDYQSVLWKSDDLISGSKRQEDPNERTTPQVIQSDGYLVSDLKSCTDVKRIESSKATPDSKPEPDEEPERLERLRNDPQFSSDSIADLTIKKLLKISEKTLMIFEQVGDPGPCKHVKRPDEDAPNHLNIGDFVSDLVTAAEEGKPRKPRKSRREEECARLEDYLHPSLLSAAASKMRKKMKKAIFEWPTEELRKMADSGDRAKNGGESGDLRAVFHSSVFRRFDDLVLKLFHA